MPSARNCRAIRPHKPGDNGGGDGECSPKSSTGRTTNGELGHRFCFRTSPLTRAVANRNLRLARRCRGYRNPNGGVNITGMDIVPFFAATHNGPDGIAMLRAQLQPNGPRYNKAPKREPEYVRGGYLTNKAPQQSIIVESSPPRDSMAIAAQSHCCENIGTCAC